MQLSVVGLAGRSVSSIHTHSLTHDLEWVNFARLNNFHLFNKVRRAFGRTVCVVGGYNDLKKVFSTLVWNEFSGGIKQK